MSVEFVIICAGKPHSTSPLSTDIQKMKEHPEQSSKIFFPSHLQVCFNPSCWAWLIFHLNKQLTMSVKSDHRASKELMYFFTQSHLYFVKWKRSFCCACKKCFVKNVSSRHLSISLLPETDTHHHQRSWVSPWMTYNRRNVLIICFLFMCVAYEFWDYL